MGQPQTLEELKAANAEAENAETDATQAEDEVFEDDAAEIETEESDDAGEQNQNEAEDNDAEAWMQTDEPASDDNDDRQFTGSDVAAAKKKYGAKLERKHDEEKQELLERIKALESGNSAPVVDSTAKPKRDDFLDEDDPDEAFFEALTDWKIRSQNSQHQAQAQQLQEREAQKAAEAARNEKVGQHYQRAATLAEKSNISPEAYKSSDIKVRSAVESVLPKQGNIITDVLIESFGEGSEKIMFYLGRNDKELAKFQDHLRKDPTGISASIYLGKLESKVTAPTKRKSSAPKPSTKISGGQQTTSGSDWKRKYDKAETLQERIDIKYEAKKAGENTKKW